MGIDSIYNQKKVFFFEIISFILLHLISTQLYILSCF